MQASLWSIIPLWRLTKLPSLNSCALKIDNTANNTTKSILFADEQIQLTSHSTSTDKLVGYVLSWNNVLPSAEILPRVLLTTYYTIISYIPLNEINTNPRKLLIKYKDKNIRLISFGLLEKFTYFVVIRLRPRINCNIPDELLDEQIK